MFPFKLFHVRLSLLRGEAEVFHSFLETFEMKDSRELKMKE
jgi:hypothetical protein